MIESERMKKAITDLEIIQNEYQRFAACSERNRQKDAVTKHFESMEEAVIKHYESMAESLEIAVRCMKVMDGYEV